MGNTRLFLQLGKGLIGLCSGLRSRLRKFNLTFYIFGLGNKGVKLSTKDTQAFSDLSTAKKAEITAKQPALLLNRHKTNCNDSL
jgi:hypothetical protein